MTKPTLLTVIILSLLGIEAFTYAKAENFAGGGVIFQDGIKGYVYGANVDDGKQYGPKLRLVFGNEFIFTFGGFAGTYERSNDAFATVGLGGAWHITKKKLTPYGELSGGVCNRDGDCLEGGGLSYFYNRIHGYVGAAFLPSLTVQGEQGIQGIQGPPGADGKPEPKKPPKKCRHTKRC